MPHHNQWLFNSTYFQYHNQCSLSSKIKSLIIEFWDFILLKNLKPICSKDYCHYDLISFDGFKVNWLVFIKFLFFKQGLRHIIELFKLATDFDFF